MPFGSPLLCLQSLLKGFNNIFDVIKSILQERKINTFKTHHKHMIRGLKYN